MRSCHGSAENGLIFNPSYQINANTARMVFFELHLGSGKLGSVSVWLLLKCHEAMNLCTSLQYSLPPVVNSSDRATLTLSAGSLSTRIIEIEDCSTDVAGAAYGSSLGHVTVEASRDRAGLPRVSVLIAAGAPTGPGLAQSPATRPS